METKCGSKEILALRVNSPLKPAWTMLEDSYPKVNKARTGSTLLSPFTRGKERVKSSKVILSYFTTSRLAGSSQSQVW